MNQANIPSGVSNVTTYSNRRNDRNTVNRDRNTSSRKKEEGTICKLGTTTVRNFLHDAFNFLFYTELSSSTDETLSALATKSLKEVKYHLRHSSNWLIRLGDGTKESNLKVQEALNFLWQYTGELFEMDEVDNDMLDNGLGVNNIQLKIYLL